MFPVFAAHDGLGALRRRLNKLLDDLRIVLAVVKKCNKTLTTIVHQHLLS
jgi:hypothetical protein